MSLRRKRGQSSKNHLAAGKPLVRSRTVVLPPVPGNKPNAVNVPDPSQVQDTVDLSEELEMNRFSPDYYALQLGNHVLGGGFYATQTV